MRNWYKTLLWAAAGAIVAAGVYPAPARPNVPRNPTFSADIYPIFRQKCLPCHTPNRVGPFRFDEYDSVKRHLLLIESQVLSRNMPPYQITSDLGLIGCGEPFTDAEMRLFQHWVSNGAPQGSSIPSHDPAQPPDSTLNIALENAPPTRAEGAPYWMLYEVPVPESAEIYGFDFLPATPGLLRSATLGIIRNTQPNPPREVVSRIGLRGNNILGAWSDGMPAFRLPPDASIDLRKGDVIRVLALYQPTGRPLDSGFTIRLLTTDQPRPKTMDVISFEDDKFIIPAGHSPTFTLGTTLAESRRIYAILPEARFYCTTFEATATTPAGKQTLFATNRWSPYWIGNFALPTTPEYSAGTTLAFRFTYNNDERCAMNLTRPPKTVQPGETIDDEACAVHVITIVDR